MLGDDRSQWAQLLNPQTMTGRTVEEQATILGAFCGDRPLYLLSTRPNGARALP